MIRLPTLVVMALIAAASALVFRTSYEVQALEDQLDALNRSIVMEQESIRVLRAEWAYLNQPSRLREMAEQYSVLAPVKPGQIISSLDEIPMPLPGAPAMAGIPLPGRKPAAVPAGPTLVADAADPAKPTRPAADEGRRSPTVPSRPPAQSLAVAPADTPVDVLLASFRQRLSAQETSQ